MDEKKPVKYGIKLKAKVALATLRGDKTLAQVGSSYGVPTHNIKFWKRQLIENIEMVFNQDKQVKNYKDKLSNKEKEIDELHRQNGKLNAQLEWLKKKCKEIGYEY